MSDCIFCRIASGEIESTTVAEGEGWMAFRDLDPRAPVHVLVVPTEHVESLDRLEDPELAGTLLRACREVAGAEGLEAGYRVVTNVGDEGGQAVRHLHFHVLGGRPMGWPPG